MRLANAIPGFLKPLLLLIYNNFTKLTCHTKSRDELHQYWMKPWDGVNLPHQYLEGAVRSKFLVEIIKRHAGENQGILEIGCNVGRNLNHLFLAGFRELSGIEISENAVQQLKQHHPEMASHARIYNVPTEVVIKDFKDGEFDVVYTMAVLEHIHSDSEWVFPEMVRVTKGILITIEDEQSYSWRHFKRNYKKVFESLGMKQIEVVNCADIDGLGSSFFARTFIKK